MHTAASKKSAAWRAGGWGLGAFLSVSSLLLLLGVRLEHPMLEGCRFVISRDLSDPPVAAPLATGGTASAQRQLVKPPTCSINVTQTPFAKHCTLLRNVCIDSSAGIILYDPRYRPDKNGPPLDLPLLAPSKRQSEYHFLYLGGHAQLFAVYPNISTRPVALHEPRRYLQTPSFSNCTVPIVYYPHFDFNFVHSFRDNAAFFYSALRETPWADHARIVYMTGNGLAISPMNQQLWQPLSKLRVDAWADFSVRLRDEEVGTLPPPGPQALPPPSYEGSEQRCFSAMYVCLDDVDAEQFQLHAYGRHVAEYHQQQHPQEVAAARKTMLQQAGLADLPRPPSESVLRKLDKQAAASADTGAGAEVQLRIVFQRRSGHERQLVNAQELVERCNNWTYTAPSGARVRALCWQAELPNLMAGIAAAQEADVFVGVHGANTANSWLMRPGSSLVELTMFEFDEDCSEKSCPHTNVPLANSQDKGSQMQVWKLFLCDPEGSWTPAAREVEDRKKGVEKNRSWVKYRNLVVRWEALETALQAVADTAGDMPAYWRRFEEGTWWWFTTATQVVPAGPGIRHRTCSKGREEGLID